MKTICKRVTICLVVLALALVLADVYSRVSGFAYTTSDHLDSIVSASGRLVWKHRSSPMSDYAAVSGPIEQTSIWWISYVRLPTAGSGWVREYAIQYLPVSLLIAGVCVILGSIWLWPSARIGQRDSGHSA